MNDKASSRISGVPPLNDDRAATLATEFAGKSARAALEHLPEGEVASAFLAAALVIYLRLNGAEWTAAHLLGLSSGLITSEDPTPRQRAFLTLLTSEPAEGERRH